MESKDEIRKRVLNLRSAMDPGDTGRKSAAVFERIYDLRQYKEAKVVLVYMDYKNEVMTGDFIKKCLHGGKKVALPKVEADGDGNKREPKASDSAPVSSTEVSSGIERNLAVYLIKDVDQDTQPGFKGIIEPDNSVLKRLDPREIDLAVIPGVAFDHGKNRVGYGAGYYDRFLHKLRKDCLKIGVAFSLQLVDMIPAEQNDFPVDMVVTEEMVMK